MSRGKGGVDARSKLGRALFALVDASRKMPAETQGRVIRVRNAIEASPEDGLVRFAVKPDLDTLMRDPKLNAMVRALWKALPS